MAGEHPTVTLYIHPEKSGPISPMQLDMLEIEIAVVGLPVNADRDEARVREIANRIKKKFPNVEPDSRIADLRWLVNRLANVTMFNGVVLRLPGYIDGASPPKNPTMIEFQKLTEESLKLKSQFEDVNQEFLKVQAQAASLEGENTRLRAAHEQQRREINRLRPDLDDIRSREHNARIEARRYLDKVNALEQEKAALIVERDQLVKERQTQRDRQQETSVLREQLKNAKDVEQQLRTRIKKLESELGDLRDRLRKLAENVVPGRADEARGPWLD